MTLLPNFKYKAKYGRMYTHGVCEDCKKKYLYDNMLSNKKYGFSLRTGRYAEEWRCIRCHNAKKKRC